MSELADEKLGRLRIEPAKKARRRSGPVGLIVLVVLLLVGGAVAFVVANRQSANPTPAATNTPVPTVPAAPPKPGEVVLTVSGYIIPRERIEISPKFQATVREITVRKGDSVEKGQVIVRLEDDEYRARVMEAEGGLALAQANLRNAEVNLKRALELSARNVDSVQATDEAKRARDAAQAQVAVAEGQLALARTYEAWCTIRAPISGVVLEKLVEPNELVVPQSFGGDRGPSTAFISMADLNDLQVEIDLNEADVAKIALNQRCRVSPEAYADKSYAGYVVEIAPEANRSKGTLQVKVQIEKPDRYLTPELTAKVEFLAE